MAKDNVQWIIWKIANLSLYFKEDVDANWVQVPSMICKI